MPANPGHLKRQKEARRAERQREKEARREARKVEKAERAKDKGDSAVDPDIAHIVPGPQPIPE